MKIRRPFRYGLALLGVFVAWIGVLATTMFLGAPSPGALVLFPSDQFIARLPRDYAITGANRFAVVVTGQGYESQTLYHLGARLVLPAGLAGCVGIFPTKGGADA